MIGKQNRDVLYFCCIFEGRGEGSIQKRTGVYSRGECNGLWVHTQFVYLYPVFFFAWKCADLQTLWVKIYTNRFQKLYRCWIPLRLFISLYQSNSWLWKSLNFIQLQAMAVLALNFRFVLDFDNSRIGVQFRNKFTLCKVNIALQTILSLRLCIAPAHD